MDSEIINARIVSSYSNGCTLKETAKAFGVPIERVTKALDAAGVKRRARGFGGMRPEDRAAIAKLGGVAVPADRRAYSQDRALASSSGSAGAKALHHRFPSDTPR